MQDVAECHGDSAVVAAQSRYRVPARTQSTEISAETRLALENPLASLTGAACEVGARPIVTITPDMADPVLRVRGLLEQALRVVDADGAFQETIRAQPSSLIQAVKTEGADTALSACLDGGPIRFPSRLACCACAGAAATVAIAPGLALRGRDDIRRLAMDHCLDFSGRSQRRGLRILTNCSLPSQLWTMCLGRPM